MLVAGLKGLKVIDVACGSGDAQTLAVTENGMYILCLPGKSLKDVDGCFPGGMRFRIE
jgi:hypothetical protein